MMIMSIYSTIQVPLLYHLTFLFVVSISQDNVFTCRGLLAGWMISRGILPPSCWASSL